MSQPGIPDVSLPPLSIIKDTETAPSTGIERKVPRVAGGAEVSLCTQRAPPPPCAPIMAMFYLRSPSVEKPKVTACWACGPKGAATTHLKTRGFLSRPFSCLPLKDTFLLGKELLTAVTCDGITYIKIIYLGKKLQVLYIC